MSSTTSSANSAGSSAVGHTTRPRSPRLVGEALSAGAEDVHVAVGADWLVVTAERDWIGALEPSVFHKVLPIPGEPNSMFAEVLLTVFAQRVITATPDHTTVIKGKDVTPPDFPGTWARVIAFDRTRN